MRLSFVRKRRPTDHVGDAPTYLKENVQDSVQVVFEDKIGDDPIKSTPFLKMTDADVGNGVEVLEVQIEKNDGTATNIRFKVTIDENGQVSGETI